MNGQINSGAVDQFTAPTPSVQIPPQILKMIVAARTAQQSNPSLNNGQATTQAMSNINSDILTPETRNQLESIIFKNSGNPKSVSDALKEKDIQGKYGTPYLSQ
jgi:hypothetical protein